MIEAIALSIVLPSLFVVAYGYGRADSRSTNYTETQIKAAYLERITKFIKWPDASGIKNVETPFILGLFGSKKMINEFIDVYSDQKIKGKTVEIRHISDVSQLQQCHMLYIPKSAKIKLSQILEVVDGKPVLTVSDKKGIVNKGIHIGLLMRRQKLKYEVNQKSIIMSTLEPSWHLLQYAYNVVNRSRR